MGVKVLNEFVKSKAHPLTLLKSAGVLYIISVFSFGIYVH